MTSVRDSLIPGGDPIGTAGSTESIREVSGDERTAESFFNQLTSGGSPVSNPKYPGRLCVIPEGGIIGLRPRSKSGPPTIDVDVPGIPIKKVKFV